MGRVLSEGDLLGGVRLERRVALGGMAEIWAGREGANLVAVKVMLGRFFAMAQSMLERATIQANSIDLSISLHSQRLTAIDERVTKLEKHRHDHANYLAQLDARVSMSRGAP